MSKTSEELAADLSAQLDAIHLDVRDLRREFAGHVADDLASLTLLHRIDEGLRGTVDGSSPGIRGDLVNLRTEVASLKSANAEKGLDRRARWAVAGTLLVSLVASCGAMATAYLK